MTVERFTFFWGGPFSQWHPCRFTVDGVLYNCAEQYMMAGKARLFGDAETEAKIMAAAHPRDQKGLGRRVRGFDEETWLAEARGIVYRGNRAKFGASGKLRGLLMSTRGTTLVEASPLDTLWGIGVAEADPRAADRSQWEGSNWLGEVLTRLREDLAAEESAESTGTAPARRAERG